MQPGADGSSETLQILIMEDDENDVLLLKRAFKKLEFPYPFYRVRDGEEGISYLEGAGAFADRNQHPYPRVILMDLKMPKKTGFDVLRWLEDHPECDVAPVIVLSSSAQEDDVQLAYKLGASSYFLKPHEFNDLLVLLQLIRDYWCKALKPKAPPC